MTQSNECKNDMLLLAIREDRPEAVSRFLCDDQAEFRGHHLDAFLRLFYRNNAESQLMVLLDVPRARALLGPVSRYLFRHCIENEMTRAPKRLTDLFRGSHSDTGHSAGELWMDEATWLRLVSISRVNPRVGTCLLGDKPTLETRKDPLQSLSARLTKLWLEDPRIDPARPNLSAERYCPSTSAFGIACSSKDEGMVCAFLSDDRVRRTVAGERGWAVRILELGSMPALDAYLSVSQLAVSLRHVEHAYYLGHLDLARRLLASPKFSTSYCLIELMAEGLVNGYAANVEWIEWLLSLSNACLRVTGHMWRCHRRERAHGTAPASSSTLPLTDRRDVSSQNDYLEEQLRIHVEQCYPPEDKCIRYKGKPFPTWPNDNHPVWSTALSTLRPWIDTIETELLQQDPYLPSDWIHGLLVDYLLGPEHAT